ncbi:chemotaxis protein CheW [Geminocystis sp. NIES-3709]|uniref:chemotaxis protein CheW n=1 Tax=Geminocystis sp. NIES-3709 TaxID=1617448 RepID=UPI0005FCB40A|nr:chemotaxis protein CheW [Geminocystis sp. NIES-3709]BAQ64153.1 chemotaxis protein [Geminocystis sp. NIES-3709]
MADNQKYSDSIKESQITLGLEQSVEGVEAPEGELHLRFVLPSGDEFALPAVGIREVMQQEPDRITPIPNASPLLLGTINLRGEIIWVADLGQFLGYPNMLNTDRSDIPVIAIEEQETILGLAVDKLGAMQWLDIDTLQIPQNIPDHIAPYIQGEWMDEHNHYVRLLDQIAILRSARWVA